MYFIYEWILIISMPTYNYNIDLSDVDCNKIIFIKSHVANIHVLTYLLYGARQYMCMHIPSIYLGKCNEYNGK